MVKTRNAAAKAPAQIYRFGHVAGNHQQALAHLRIGEGALRFVEQGLRNTYSRQPQVAFGAFDAMARAALLRRLDDGMLGMGGKATASWEKDQENAIRAFHRAFAEHSDLIFGKLPPPWIGGCPRDAEIASAKAILGAAPLDEPAEGAGLERAYAVAKFNVVRAEQRAAVLFLLAELVRRGSRGDLPAPAQGEFDQASAAFFGARTLHISRMLAMGLLLGGAAAEECRAFVKHQYREGISVVELLEVDGVMPGQWPTATEAKLRKALDKA